MSKRWDLTPLKVAFLRKNADRIAAGLPPLTYADLSLALGKPRIPPSTIGAYMNNQVADPPMPRVSRVAAYLGLTVEELIIEEEDEAENRAPAHRKIKDLVPMP